jgi:hypothetical protein
MSFSAARKGGKKEEKNQKDFTLSHFLKILKINFCSKEKRGKTRRKTQKDFTFTFQKKEKINKIKLPEFRQ